MRDSKFRNGNGVVIKVLWFFKVRGQVTAVLVHRGSKVGDNVWYEYKVTTKLGVTFKRNERDVEKA